MIISHRQIENIIKTYQTNELKNSKTVDNKEKTNFKGKKDKIEISDKASDLKIAMEALSKVPDVRENKIQPLKEKIEDGAYNVEGEKVAEKIIDRVLVDKFV